LGGVGFLRIRIENKRKSDSDPGSPIELFFYIALLS